MKPLNIYDKLNKSINSNPEENFLKSIKDVKNKCLPKKL